MPFKFRRTAIILVSALALLAGIPAGADLNLLKPQRAVPNGQLMAGAAMVDSTWHVGASAGQYASDGTSVGDHGVDYHRHTTRRSPSYGIQGREWTRALVVQGSNGERWALVANDLYIPQDLLNRRVAQLIAEYDKANPQSATGITPENMTLSVSHSHSSPYYSTPSWGVWAFQDVFDIRFFEHAARKMADAVIAASSDMVPVRVGAATSSFRALKRHSYGPASSYDGLPGGYPKTDIDPELTVVAFDDITNPAAPTTLATWVVFGLHPEMLDGNDLLTGEYVNTMYRIADRELGGVTLFSQNDTGTAEPARNAEAHSPSERQEFSHKEYAQMERAARQLATAVGSTRHDVKEVSLGGQETVSSNVVPFTDSAPVKVKDLRFAPPGTRLLPSVSSCRTEKAFDGNPGFPIVGLPDCGFIFGNGGRAPLPFDPGVTYDTLVKAGVPIPDNTSAPSYTGLQETVQVHLQAVRIGGIGITICPCEQWADQSRNIKTRLDLTPGNLWYGWDWTANYNDPGWQPGVIYDGKPLPGHGPLTLNSFCTQNPNTTWTCKNPGNPAANLAPVSDESFRRMKAQIYNDAQGWDSPENILTSESEAPTNDAVWGNFTHEELPDFGYQMVVTVGMSNDYWGYIASYREFQRGDHYRKALTGLGPHSMDFLSTRLSRMAAELNGGPEVELNAKDVSYQWDYSHQGLRAEAIGRTARTHLAAYESGLPKDGGSPGITAQPSDITRFQAARIDWVGGSNYVDAPTARVERCTAPNPAACVPEDSAVWAPYADGQGEVQVIVNYPRPDDMALVAAGEFQWRWSATFEAFSSDISLPDASGMQRTQTPEGTYRFVIDGCFRGDALGSGPSQACPAYDQTGRVRPYRLVSQPFAVSAWQGIQVSAPRLEQGEVRFDVGPVFPYAASASNTELGPIDLPNTYSSPFRFIKGREGADVVNYSDGSREVFCYHCSFRPWADTSAIADAVLTVERFGGTVETFSATCDSSGLCRVNTTLGAGDRAWVASAGVRDTFGEFNGTASSVLAI